MNWFRKIRLRIQLNKAKKEHIHRWDLRYRFMGNSEVCRCDCETWAVKYDGKAEYHIITLDE